MGGAGNVGGVGLLVGLSDTNVGLLVGLHVTGIFPWVGPTVGLLVILVGRDVAGFHVGGKGGTVVGQNVGGLVGGVGAAVGLQVSLFDVGPSVGDVVDVEGLRVGA